MNSNGYTTCNEPYNSTRAPRDLPLNVIAVLWTDTDGRVPNKKTCVGDNLVFTHMYEAESGAVDSVTDTVMRRAGHDAALIDQLFNVSWVIVVTWYKMVPWPYKTYGSTNQVGDEILSYCKLILFLNLQYSY